jgi:hypothetical protein
MEMDKNLNPVSRIWDKQPGSATLVLTTVKKKRMATGDKPSYRRPEGFPGRTHRCLSK